MYVHLQDADPQDGGALEANEKCEYSWEAAGPQRSPQESKVQEKTTRQRKSSHITSQPFSFFSSLFLILFFFLIIILITTMTRGYCVICFW